MKTDGCRANDALYISVPPNIYLRLIPGQRIKVRFYLIILFVLCNTCCFAQSVDQIVESLDNINRKYPIEKVHVHLDKTSYQMGDLIWLKAYVTDESNRLSMLSRVLYVDLLDQELQVINSVMLELSSGLASGNILISNKIKKGNYELRAYTKWMRNYGEQSFFSQNILIGETDNFNLFNKNKSVGKTFLNSEENKIDLQFFPEGGSLVNGIRSKIAFKAKDSKGHGITVSGHVLDERGLRVAEFESEHAGIGSFMLTPDRSKFTAVITSPKGERKFILPESKNSGYVLQVLDEDTVKIRLRVISGQKLQTDTNLSILVRSGLQTHYMLKFKLRGLFTELIVSKENLPEGIIQLSLLDQNSVPLAERLIYNQTGDYLDFQLLNDTAKYNINQKIRMQWAISNRLDQNISGNFSISVTKLDDTSLPAGFNQTIFSNLLLTSELKNQIEDPSYYFVDTSIHRRRQLDQLLLTQDWYRWTVRDIASGVLPSIYFQPEQGLSVSGVVIGQGKPLIKGKVSLFSPGFGISMDTLTDQYGRFSFDRLIFSDSTRFVVQARSAKGNDNLEILMDPEPTKMKHSLLRMRYPTDQQDLVSKSSEKVLLDTFANSNLLAEVVVRAVKDSRDVRASSKLGNTNADFVFRPSQLSGANLGDALVGKIAGLEITHDPRTLQTFAYLRRNKLQSGNAKMQMRVFIDNVDYGYDLSMVGMSEIATVEIFKGGAGSALYGDKGFGGVIIVTTKTFGEQTSEVLSPVKGIVQITPRGFSFGRDFFLSKEEYFDPVSKHVNGFHTLYWNPAIIQKAGGIEFDFSSGSHPGRYRMIIEGIDQSGRLGRKVYDFNIND